MAYINYAALNWFQSRAGKTLTWKELQEGPCVLTISAKGIFKPADQEYALSIRQTLDSPYADEEPQYQPDGSWTYRYAQEESASGASEHLFTNQGLAACMRDRIPVAVLRQLSKKPDITRYQILGLATVDSWNQGVFTFRSTTLGPQVTEAEPSKNSQADARANANYDPSEAQDARRRVLRELVARQGQSAFRSGLLTAYEGQCAISGCSVQMVLEAAHITPYLGPDTNSVSNGLLLRSDLHALWDRGLIYVDEQWRIRVVSELTNTEYALFQGKAIFLPVRVDLRPSSLALAAHREWCVSSTTTPAIETP